MTNIYDNRRCSLGEGALWHPERQQLFWFDIIGKRLLSVQDGQQLEWQFDNNVSAAGWIDRDNLLIASDNAFLTLNLETGAVTHLLDLEADNATTRSNDGRADPWGGFWIGTMGRKAEPGAGTIYRLFQGEVRPLFRGITITNTICFAPDGSQAYFSDTARQQIMVQPLDEDGWPQGDARVFLDLSGSGRSRRRRGRCVGLPLGRDLGRKRGHPHRARRPDHAIRPAAGGPANLSGFRRPEPRSAICDKRRRRSA